MVHNNNGTVTGEVDSRLQDLFGGIDESPTFEGDSGEPGKTPAREPEELPEDVEDRASLENSPLKELGAVLLSADWEINDEIMNDLIERVDGLRSTYKDDKTTLLFLQLLGSVGKYIKVNKANALPDAVKLLNSLYAGLVKVALSKDMTEAARKKVLLARVVKFKQLKEQIALTKDGTAKKRGVPSPGSHRPSTGKRIRSTGLQEKIMPGRETLQEMGQSDMNRMLPHETSAFALEEIKEVIKAEFKALRAELKLWREGQ